jgi:hypothetical protein
VIQLVAEPTQAETWVQLRLDPRQVTPVMTWEEWRQWQELCAGAVPPGDPWDCMIHTHQGRRVRITRCDFPDTSSAVATETWHRRPGCEDSAEYGYELVWRLVPVGNQ